MELDETSADKVDSFVLKICVGHWNLRGWDYPRKMESHFSTSTSSLWGKQDVYNLEEEALVKPLYILAMFR